MKPYSIFFLQQNGTYFLNKPHIYGKKPVSHLYTNNTTVTKAEFCDHVASFVAQTDPTKSSIPYGNVMHQVST
jgi:hypothetical protein